MRREREREKESRSQYTEMEKPRLSTRVLWAEHGDVSQDSEKQWDWVASQVSSF